MGSPHTRLRFRPDIARLMLSWAALLALGSGCSPKGSAGALATGGSPGAGQSRPAHTVITEANACQLQELARLDRDPVVAVRFSPQGDFVAVAKTHEIQILNGGDLALQRTIPHEERIEKIAISPDARLVATLAADTVQQWDLATATLRSRVAGDEVNFLDLGYTADGESLVATSWEGLHVWPTGEATLQRRFEDLEGGSQLTFTADGEHVVFPGQWGSTCLEEWNVATGAEGNFLCLEEAEEWEEPPLVAVSAVDDLIAIAPEEGSILLFEKDGAGALRRRVTLGEGLLWVSRVEFSPDGRYLAASGWTLGAGQEIHVWEVAQASEILHLEGERFAFAPDAQALLVGYAGSLRLHSLPSGETAAAVEARMMVQFTLAPDGDRMALTMSDGTVEIRSKRGQELTATFADPEISAQSIQFSPDGDWVLAGSEGGAWAVWHIGTDTRAWMIPSAEGAVILGEAEFVLVRASDRSTLELRQLRDGTVVRRLEHPAEIRGFVVSGEGRLLATNVVDETVWLWHLPGGEFERSLDEYHFALAFSPDGSRLATQGEGGVLRIWSTSDGSLIAEHAFGNDDFYMEWAAGGEQVLVWIDDPTATYLWDPGQTPPAELEEEYAPLLSPDGRILITRSWAGALHFRNLTSGEVRDTGEAVVQRLWPMALSPNGEVLMTREWRGPIQIWGTTSLQPACILLDDSDDVQYGYFDDQGVRLAIYSEFLGLSLWGIP